MWKFQNFTLIKKIRGSRVFRCYLLRLLEYFGKSYLLENFRVRVNFLFFQTVNNLVSEQKGAFIQKKPIYLKNIRFQKCV